MYENRECWLCGRNGQRDPLDKHHIFGGANRKKSEKYGLVVFLCHDRCHENGKHAAHRDPETARRLHEYGQRKAMAEQGWTREEFVLEFGRNYLEEDEGTDASDGEAGTDRTTPQSAPLTAPLTQGSREGRAAAGGRSLFRATALALPF